MKAIVALSVAALLAGCVAPAPHQASTQKRSHEGFKPIAFKYDDKSSASMNYQRRLDLVIFSCGLTATTGAMARRYASPQDFQPYIDDSIACARYAHSEGDKALADIKEARKPGSLSASEKDLYAKWQTYLSSMSPFQNTDQLAKAAYDQARSTLITEDKLSR